MGVVDLEADLVHADQVTVFQSNLVVEDAAPDMTRGIARGRIREGEARKSFADYDEVMGNSPPK